MAPQFSGDTFSRPRLPDCSGDTFQEEPERKRRLRLAAVHEDRDMSSLAAEALEQYLNTKGL